MDFKLMIDYLNQHNGLLMLIFTGVVALSTVIYAVLTGILVAETRSMRFAQTEPAISVSYRMRDEYFALLDIVVSNLGPGAAYDISFEVSPVSGGSTADTIISELHNINFVKSGLKYLAPGREMASFFLNVNEDFEAKMATKIRFKASYRNAAKRSITEEFIIDFSELRGISSIGTPDMHKIAKALEQIQKDFGNITSGFKKLNVDVFTEADREENTRAIRERIDEQRRKRSGPGGMDAKPPEGSV